MIGRDHGDQHLADVVVVRVRSLHQRFQILQEQIPVERDRRADVNQLVVGLFEAFFGHQLLFVELFARTQTGILDRNIHIRFESRLLDQVARQRIDLDRTAHIEHEDLAALCVGAGQHHEADRLRNRHKVADDVRMRDRDGTALCDLLFEQRDDGTVAAEHVAEAHRDEFRFDIAEHAAGAVLVRVLTAFVREQLRNLVRPARLDLCVEALHDHFAQTLAGAHDVGRVDRFVGRNQHKALAAVDHRRVCGFIGAEDVVLDRFARAVLHQRHVLVRRRVIDDLRVIGLEHLEHPAAVTYRTDQYHEVQIAVPVPELLLDVVCAVFVDVEENQLLRLVRGNLPAELAADRSAAAGNQDRLAVNERKDLAEIFADRIAAQKVFDRDVLHRADGDLSGDQLIHAGQLLELAVGLVADREDVALLFCRRARNRKVYLVDVVLIDVGEDVVAVSDDRNAFQIAAALVRIVVDDADDLIL